jgi:RimJ/RimL family protein N-acetyltransferase
LCWLHAINQNYKSAEIGFRVDKSYAWKWIMTKCVKTIIKIGFDMWLERISADTVCDNIAAQKVLIKSWFLFEWVLKKWYKIDWVLVDSQLYAIVK